MLQKMQWPPLSVQHTIGRLGNIPSIIQWLSCVLVGCIFYDIVKIAIGNNKYLMLLFKSCILVLLISTAEMSSLNYIFVNRK